MEDENIPTIVAEHNDLAGAINKIKSNMNLAEQDITSSIIMGDDDDEIATEGGYPIELVSEIREKLQTKLANFTDNPKVYKKALITLPASGSPANLFKVIYSSEFKNKVLTFKTLREKIGISSIIAERDINRLYKAGLIKKTGSGDSAIITRTLDGIIIVEELYKALIDLGAKPTILQIQNITKKVIKKFKGNINLNEESIFEIPLPGYNLRSNI